MMDSGNIKVGKKVWSSTVDDRFVMFGDGNFIRIGETTLDDQLSFFARNFTFNASSGVDYFGFVGIGNTSPTEKLDVTGNVKVSGTITTQNLKILSTSAATGYHLRTGSDGNVASTKGYGALGVNYITPFAEYILPREARVPLTIIQLLAGSGYLLATSHLPDRHCVTDSYYQSWVMKHYLH